MEKKTSPKKARAAKKTVKAAKAAPRARAAAKKAPKSKAPKPKAPLLGLTKRFVKGKPVVKITFRLPKSAAGDASAVSVVGDFNGWQAGASPMKRQKDGSFTSEVELQAGRDYRFRYLVDGGRWENDWCADRYEPNDFGGEDSVVSC